MVARTVLVAVGLTTGLARAQPAPEPMPPRLVHAETVILPPDAEPLPPGSSLELILDVDSTGRVTAVEVVTSLRPDIDVLEYVCGDRPRSEDEVNQPREAK